MYIQEMANGQLPKLAGCNGGQNIWVGTCEVTLFFPFTGAVRWLNVADGINDGTEGHSSCR